MIFFKPNSKFFKALSENVNYDARIVEIGAGEGSLSKELNENGWSQTCPIDLIPNFDNGVYIFDATEFDYSEFDAVICARPCHSGFVQDAFGRAFQDGVRVFYYISKPANLMIDFDELFMHDFEFELIETNIGEDGEHLWKIY